MIYIKSDSNDPYYNLAFEDYIFENYKGDDILLLYINRPVIVCGKYQNIFAEANIPYALDNGVALIRRTSGGGTVYHDLGNINYSIIKDADDSDYSYFINIITSALERLGINSNALQKSGIAINGYKISGGAQKISKGRLMHHGTLLYDTDLDNIYIMANGKNESYKGKAPESNPFRVANIKDFLADKSITTEEFRDMLLDSIRKTIELKVMELSEDEKEKVRQLASEKYKNWEWTFSNSPNFIFERNIVFNGIEHKIKYKAVKGIIKEFSIYPECIELSNLLNNQALDYIKIKDKIKDLDGYNEIYKYIF